MKPTIEELRIWVGKPEDGPHARAVLAALDVADSVSRRVKWGLIDTVVTRFRATIAPSGGKGEG